MKWPILLGAFLLSAWVLPGCLQGTQSAGGVATPAGDTTAIADATPPPDATADTFLPIDPKLDPRSIDNDKDREVEEDIETVGEPKLPITGDMLGGQLEVTPPADVRLRYGTDSRILAKSPATSYVIHAKSSTLALSFTVEQNWDPALADQYWKLLTSDYDSKPQLRAIYIPPGLHQHILYSDAEWAADASGAAVYTFSNLSVVEGGELRFFAKETKTADFHSGGLVALDSYDAAKPFPSDAAATFYPVGSFLMKAVTVSPTQGPTVHQSESPALPINP